MEILKRQLLENAGLNIRQNIETNPFIICRFGNHVYCYINKEGDDLKGIKLSKKFSH